MSHSPHSRQVSRVAPWMLPYAGSSIICFGWRLAAGPGGERDRERRLDHLQPERLGGLAQRLRLRQVGVRVGRRRHHRLDGVVVTVEIVAPDRPVLVAAARAGASRARTIARPCAAGRWRRSASRRRAPTRRSTRSCGTSGCRRDRTARPWAPRTRGSSRTGCARSSPADSCGPARGRRPSAPHRPVGRRRRMRRIPSRRRPRRHAQRSETRAPPRSAGAAARATCGFEVQAGAAVRGSWRTSALPLSKVSTAVLASGAWPHDCASLPATSPQARACPQTSERRPHSATHSRRTGLARLTVSRRIPRELAPNDGPRTSGLH